MLNTHGRIRDTELFPQHRCRNSDIHRQTCEDGATQRSLSCSASPALHSSSFPSLQGAFVPSDHILTAKLDLLLDAPRGNPPQKGRTSSPSLPEHKERWFWGSSKNSTINRAAPGTFIPRASSQAREGMSKPHSKGRVPQGTPVLAGLGHPTPEKQSLGIPTV